MVGAELIAAGIEALIQDGYSLNHSEEEVAELQITFLSVRIVLCYALFGVGFAAQYLLWRTEIKALNEYHPLVRPAACIKFLMLPLYVFEGRLSGACDAVLAKTQEKAEEL